MDLSLNQSTKTEQEAVREILKQSIDHSQENLNQHIKKSQEALEDDLRLAEHGPKL